jgi:hypothetical protein
MDRTQACGACNVGSIPAEGTTPHSSMQKVPVIVLLLISASGVILGDFFAKYWSLHQRTIFYVIAIVGIFMLQHFLYADTVASGTGNHFYYLESDQHDWLSYYWFADF